MANVWGGIESFFGLVLNGIYQVIPSYGVAIILLTIAVRLVLFPLGVKQIRSMTAMQKIQPKVKELQKKHKGDRQRLNEEMMKLYREHGVNPLGGCMPMLLQLPVFIALYAVIRAVVPFQVDLAQPISFSQIKIERTTVCRLAEPGTSSNTRDLTCFTGDKSETVTLQIKQASITKGHDKDKKFPTLPPYVTNCFPHNAPADKEGKYSLIPCGSPLGTGQLPKDGKLIRALVQDKATFLGMHLACSPTQATSKKTIRTCTAAAGAGGGGALVAYYAMVLLMAGTTFYQQKQMTARQPQSPQQQQMQMMTRIMPIFMGFLALQFPAALSLYWVVGNFWMIGQQHFILKTQAPPDGGDTAEPPKGGKPKPARPGAFKGAAGRPGKRK